MNQKLLYFPDRNTTPAAVGDFSCSWRSADLSDRHTYDIDIREVSKERVLDGNIYLGAAIVFGISGTFWAGIAWMAFRWLR